MRQRRIKVSVPEEFIQVKKEDTKEFVFDYLKRIGFSKRNFQDVIKIDSHDYLDYEFFIDKLPEINANIPTDIFAGAYYLIYMMDSKILSEERLYSIIVDLRGGISICYFKDKKEKSPVRLLKYELENWIQEVNKESDNDMDPEIRNFEFLTFDEKLRELSTEIEKNSYDYNYLIRPGCDIQKQLKIIKERLVKLNAEIVTQ